MELACGCVEVVAFFDGAVVDVQYLLGRGYEIGDDARASFVTPAGALGVPRLSLVRAAPAGEFDLVFTAEMRGEVTDPGAHRISSLGELAARGASAGADGTFAYRLPAGARVRVKVGAVTFLLAVVAPPERYAVGWTIEWGQQSYTAGTAATLMTLLVLFDLMPRVPVSLALDHFDARRLTHVTYVPPVVKPVPGSIRAVAPRGTTTRPPAATRPAARPVAVDGKKEAGRRASESFLIRALRDQAGSQIGSVFGSGSALGSDATVAMGQIHGGGGPDDYAGQGGNGFKGDRIRPETIGVGCVGNCGATSHYGQSTGALRSHRALAPDAVPGQATVVGALDKEIIRRVIRQHLNEVKFCYEQRLQYAPSLAGRVAVQFTIGANGRVLAAGISASTLGDRAAEACIATAVRRWDFPSPVGGGAVSVSYPFMLQAAGDN